ncbi:MAG: thiamine-monophosphate kinase [Verrucomicrobia bacterium]|nr:MAG: thiamine-monophosphate kinase [Verrucomicrobiota bacterium]
MAEATPGTLRDLGEDAVIARLCAALPGGPDLVAGPGDDCAVMRTVVPGQWRLLKTDCVVEGVHFLSGTEPERVGWKAAARAVSDFAAMGGAQPEEALITLIAPPECPMAWAEGLYAGLRRCAERFGFGVVGGETSRPPAGCAGVIVSVALSGTIAADRCRFRSGARPGDGIWTTGQLGGSFASGKHLDFMPRLAEARWLVENLGVTALMDLSDGLARDLPRMAARSGVGFRLDGAALPLSSGSDLAGALGDGEDYELLVAISGEPAAGQLAEWGRLFPGLALTRIGEFVPFGAGDGLTAGGWDPFEGGAET